MINYFKLKHLLLFIKTIFSTTKIFINSGPLDFSAVQMCKHDVPQHVLVTSVLSSVLVDVEHLIHSVDLGHVLH